MTSCFPFGSHSRVSKQKISAPTLELRPGSNQSALQNLVDTQPTTVRQPSLKVTGSDERHRARSVPDVRRSLSRRSFSPSVRKVKTTPNWEESPAVHEAWVGARNDEVKSRDRRSGPKRRVSEPTKPSELKDDMGVPKMPEEHRAPARARAQTLRESSGSETGERARTRARSQTLRESSSSETSRMSVSPRPVRRATLSPFPQPPRSRSTSPAASLRLPPLRGKSPQRALPLPPSPRVSATLESSETQPQQLSPAPVSKPTVAASPKLSLNIPETVTRPIPEYETPILQLSRRSSKRVTFSEDNALISPAVLKDLSEQRTSERCDSLISPPLPAATLTPPPTATLARHKSLSSAPDSATVKSILRRTSSYQAFSPKEDEHPALPRVPTTLIMEKNLKRLPRSKSLSQRNPRKSEPLLPLLPLPKIPNQPAPTSEANRYKRHTMITAVPTSSQFDLYKRHTMTIHLPTPNFDSDTSSTRSHASSSSFSSADDTAFKTMPKPQTQTQAPAQTQPKSTPRRSTNWDAKRPSAPTVNRRASSFVSTAQRSAHVEGKWLRRGSIHGALSSPPPVPPLPMTLATVKV